MAQKPKFGPSSVWGAIGRATKKSKGGSKGGKKVGRKKGGKGGGS